MSSFAGARKPTPIRRTLTWNALVSRLSDLRHRAVPTKAARLDAVPCWSPCVFEDRKPRSKETALRVSALVLDYDDKGATLDSIRAAWSDWAHVVHTSWSHTDKAHRCRLVVPLTVPIPAEMWPRLWTWAYRRAPDIDDRCSDASRIYFLPTTREHDSPFEVHTNDGPPLDVGSLELPAVDDTAPIARALPGKNRTRAPRPRAARQSRGDMNRSEKRRYKMFATDPKLREEAARRVGAKIVDNRATRAPCPQCGKESVWWWIEPTSMVTAQCDHRNTCGWYGPVFELWE